MFNQFKWYYNITLTATHNYYKNRLTEPLDYSHISIRNLLRKYEVTEEKFDHLTFQDLIYREDRNEFPKPSYWDHVYDRVIRGAIEKYVMALNSALSNYKNGNIEKFKMRYLGKKNPFNILYFEDKGFPAFIRKIKSNYWFTNRNGKKSRISFTDIDIKKGCEIIYEKKTNKYFLHYTVPTDWYPEEDRRRDSQTRYTSKEDRIIALDPGVRKFLVGYDPSGNVTFFGESASKILTFLLKKTDKEKDYHTWKYIKNLVSELHWKCISYLVSNYDTILLPDFRISGMVKKKTLNKMTKRLLCMFSFHSFKTKLEFQCKRYDKKLIIVDESYTSCTCTNCFHIKKLKGEEEYKCESCGMKIDRDVNGARNILIKNLNLRSG